jgi:hypothetical protein
MDTLKSFKKILSLITVLLSVLVFVCFFTGCRGSSLPARDSHGDPKRDTDLISQDQAKIVARKEAARRGINDYELGNVRLAEKCYWRVVAQSRSPTAQQNLTNVFPAVVSKEEAEAIARQNAKSEFPHSTFDLRPAELIQGPFWFVTVEHLPATPGAHFTFVISARDGTLLKTTPGM